MQSFTPILVSVNDTKRLLSIGHTKVYQLINAGRLERVKIGAKTLITVESVHRYAASLVDEVEAA